MHSDKSRKILKFILPSFKLILDDATGLEVLIVDVVGAAGRETTVERTV